MGLVELAAQALVLGDELADKHLAAAEEVLERSQGPGAPIALTRVLHAHLGEDITPQRRPILALARGVQKSMKPVNVRWSCRNRREARCHGARQARRS